MDDDSENIILSAPQSEILQNSIDRPAIVVTIGIQGPAGPRGATGASGVTNITGLIEQGTNITLTGSGTINDPYIINSSGGDDAVSAVFGRIGAVTAQASDYAAFYVPYNGASGTVDLNNQNLINIGNFGLNGDILFSGDGNIVGPYNIIGATIFSGSGANDVTILGLYSGVTTPTYIYTVNDISGCQTLQVDTLVGFSVGDVVSGDAGATAIIVSIRTSGLNNFIIVNNSNDLNGSSTLTDNMTSDTANIISCTGLSDSGTFTDGVTTIDFAELATPQFINGVTYNAGSAIGHTLGDNWSAMISQMIAPGLSLDFGISSFYMGDGTNANIGNQFATQATGARSQFQIKDKFGAYLSIDTLAQTSTLALTPILSALGGLGDGIVAIDNTGKLIWHTPGVTRGEPFTFGDPNAVLFTNPALGIESTPDFTYDAGTLYYLSIGFIGTPYFILDPFGNFSSFPSFIFGDTFSGSIQSNITLNASFANLTVGGVNCMQLSPDNNYIVGDVFGFFDGTSMTLSSSSNAFTIKINSNIPLLADLNAQNYIFGANGFGNGTAISITDSAGTLTLNAINGVIIPNLSSSSTNIVTVDSSGNLGIQPGYSGTIATAKLTTVGSNGSMTFVDGILTSQTSAT